MSDKNTAALEQLFPHMNAEEIAKQRSLNEELVEYHPIDGGPFTRAYVKEQKRWYLLMGRTKMETEGFERWEQIHEWMAVNMWTLIMRVSSTVCRDMIQPYIQMQAAKEAGVRVNAPEVIVSEDGARVK